MSNKTAADSTMRVTISVVNDDGTRYEGAAELRPMLDTIELRSTETNSVSNAGRGLPSHILDLRGKGFFQDAKTAVDVHLELSPNYPCDLNRVEVALLRLQRRKELRKTSKLVAGKKQAAYAW